MPQVPSLASFSPRVHGLSPRHRPWRLPALLALVGALAVGTPAALADTAVKSAQPGPTAGPLRPLDLVKSSVSRVQAIVRSQPEGGQRRAEIRLVVVEMFDFNEMARRTLAQHWNNRSRQEQEEFVGLFTDLLERSYLATISYRLAAITFQGESVTGSSAQVRGRLLTDRRVEIPIEYRLLESGGRWAVYDVVVEGVSLIGNYRSQFNSIIRTSSFPQLMERLRGREARALPGPGQKP
ncbi:MAG: ABC transporter substrate-binding protein [Candidatus Rokubacteria bacterium]|nr:ABC transporter substrate-binding protein [Candidatus Rokubacteria bacterium]